MILLSIRHISYLKYMPLCRNTELVFRYKKIKRAPQKTLKSTENLSTDTTENLV